LIWIFERSQYSGYLGGFRINSEVASEEVFKEYKELGPKRRSLEHYVVIFLHLAAAAIFFVVQLNNGFSPEFYGNGIVTPILLIINGFAYAYIENDSWNREQMVPFISRLITTTEIETDRFCQYHRRVARGMLIIGWVAILVSQWVTNFGFSMFGFFTSDDLVIRIVGELVAYGLFFGPYLLYFLLLLAIASVLDPYFNSRYKDIAHLVEIKNKWTKEAHRRVKNPEAVLEEEPTSEFHW